jgi:anti-sigma factor RsiW
MTIADETLMAYADGTLESAERARIAAAIAADPALAQRVALLRAGGEAARRAFAGVLAEPVPPRLLAAIAAAATAKGATETGATDTGASDTGATDRGATDRGATDTGATDTGATGTGGTDQAAAAASDAARNAAAMPAAIPALPPRLAGAARRRPWRGALALAASLLLGLVGGLALAPGAPPDRLGPALRAALDRAPSGTAADGVRLLASHAMPDGGICRVFTAPGEAGRVMQGLACRAPQGGWSLHALVVRAAPAAAFATAAAEDPLLVEALERLGAGPALAEPAERAAIRDGWPPAWPR